MSELLLGEDTPHAPPVTPVPTALETKDADWRMRRELRRQIASLEGQLAELFATAFPRRGIECSVAAAGGPRVLGTAELETVRDRLAMRLREAQDELSRRTFAEERNRETVEGMIIEPERYKWLRISNEDVGERGCKHWHVRPRWGVVGLFLNWWRVKLSSGCPLAGGRGLAASRSDRPTDLEEVAKTTAKAAPAARGGGRDGLG